MKHFNTNLSDNDMFNFFDFHFMVQSNMFFRALQDGTLCSAEKAI